MICITDAISLIVTALLRQGVLICMNSAGKQRELAVAFKRTLFDPKEAFKLRLIACDSEYTMSLPTTSSKGSTSCSISTRDKYDKCSVITQILCSSRYYFSSSIFETVFSHFHCCTFIFKASMSSFYLLGTVSYRIYTCILKFSIYFDKIFE